MEVTLRGPAAKRTRPGLRRGVALITALLLMVVLLVLGVGFLYFMERDYYQQVQQGRSARAFYLARSGLSYFYYKDREYPGYFDVGVTTTPYTVAPGEFFELTKDATGGCTSRAWIEDAIGRQIGQRTLHIPGGGWRGGGVPLEMYDADL